MVGERIELGRILTKPHNRKEQNIPWRRNSVLRGKGIGLASLGILLIYSF